jgi:sugar phosphate isomerase/epimerase
MSMRLGIANGPLPLASDGITPELADRLVGLGIRSVAFHLGDTDVLLAGGASRVRAILADHDIVVAQSTGYAPNLVDPDPATRQEALAKVRRGLAVAEALGAVMVNTGVGSHHPTSAYGPHPENHSARSIDTLIEHLRTLCPEAQDRGLLLSLEPHLLTTISDPNTIGHIVEGVGHPALRINFDPVNLLGTLPEVFDAGAAIGRMGRRMGAFLSPSAHVKDILPLPELVLHLAEVPPGEGYVDWAAYFAVCRGMGDGAALIVEHLHGDAVEPALEATVALAERHGVRLA